MHRHLLHNQEVRLVTDPCLNPGQVGFLNGWGVFSTLRVSQGVLFAWERHWARMERDAGRMHVPFPTDPESLHADLLRLVAANEAYDSTLRVAVVRNQGGMFEAPGQTRAYDVVAFTTNLRQWGASVSLAVKPNARHGANEFRGAKITTWANNLVWYEQATQRGFDEVVLLDEFGRVSECTSANLFACFGDIVRTPPLDSGCLPGITRQLLLEAVRAPGVTVIEQHLTLPDLEEADEVFITSSTRDTLAVSAIEGLRLHLANSPARQLLYVALQEYLRQYVTSRRAVSVAESA